jgi:hypothetical protein
MGIIDEDQYVLSGITGFAVSRIGENDVIYKPRAIAAE